jgi:V-type H+-transporting ATPase subunit H
MDVALIIRFSAVFSTFDEYASEVESGHLSWSPTHESEEFWKENVEKIRFEKNGKVVK